MLTRKVTTRNKTLRKTEKNNKNDETLITNEFLDAEFMYINHIFMFILTVYFLICTFIVYVGLMMFYVK